MHARPNGCTVASGVVGVTREPVNVCLIFGVSTGLERG